MSDLKKRRVGGWLRRLFSQTSAPARPAVDSGSGRSVPKAAIAAGLVAATIQSPVAAATPTANAASAFVQAARINQIPALRNALKAGIDPNTGTEEHGPAIVAAAFAESWEAVLLLAKAKGIDLNRTNSKDETVLMLAALKGRLDVVKQLVEAGAEVNRQGWTPLHYAVVGGKADVVKYLLEESAYIDAQSPNATTPLMMAARQNVPSIAELLIEEGADPTPKNQSNLSAADYFERNGDSGRAKWLREKAKAFEERYGTEAAPKFTSPR